MSTMWFTRTPGSIVDESSEEEGALLIGRGDPDWVRMPAELGGRELKVLEARPGVCPKCGAQARHLDLEDRYGVAECPGDGFVWYRTKEIRIHETSDPTV